MIKNKVINQATIPMLAKPYEGLAQLKRLLPKNTSPLEIYVQPKLNGVRAMFTMDAEGKNGRLVTRGGHNIESCPELIRELSQWLMHTGQWPMLRAIDGEIYRHDTEFDAISGAVRRKDHSFTSSTLEYHIFDMVRIDPIAPFKVRLSALEKLRTNATTYRGDHIKIVSTTVLQNSTLESLAADIVAQETAYCQQGYEGIIIRLDKPYEHRRSSGLLKHKPTFTDTYKIIGYYQEEDQYGVPKDALGGLVVTSLDNPSPNDCFRVGTGAWLTQSNRYHAWKQRNRLIGATCTINYTNISPANKPRPASLQTISVSINPKESCDELPS